MREIANWILDYADRKRFPITNMSLNKLAYFAYGPRHSLKPVTDIIKQVIVDGIDDVTAYMAIPRRMTTQPLSIERKLSLRRETDIP